MDILDRLAKSKFRSRFKLGVNELNYIREKGLDKIKIHAEDFIRDRVAPAEPANDGKQTPMRGHPVFIAQHATATCCRGCIEKWHKFPQHRELTQTEQEYLVSVIMEWINRQINSNPEWKIPIWPIAETQYFLPWIGQDKKYFYVNM